MHKYRPYFIFIFNTTTHEWKIICIFAQLTNNDGNDERREIYVALPTTGT